MGETFQNCTRCQVSHVLFPNKILKLVCSKALEEGRIAGSHMRASSDTVFTGSQTGTENYDWTPRQGVILLIFRN